jgi:hypothetical protein
MLKQAAGVANHVSKLEVDRLEMGIQPFAAAGLQRAQQAIASKLMVCRGFGHKNRFFGFSRVSRKPASIAGRTGTVTLNRFGRQV